MRTLPEAVLALDPGVTRLVCLQCDDSHTAGAGPDGKRPHVAALERWYALEARRG